MDVSLVDFWDLTEITCFKFKLEQLVNNFSASERQASDPPHGTSAKKAPTIMNDVFGFGTAIPGMNSFSIDGGIKITAIHFWHSDIIDLFCEADAYSYASLLNYSPHQSPFASINAILVVSMLYLIQQHSI